MSVDGPRRVGANPSPRAPSELAERLSQPLTDEPRLLDEFIAAAGNGAPIGELLRALNEAAAAQNRVEQLKAAYRRNVRKQRLQHLPPGIQAELYLASARFLADVARDSQGALRFAEQASAADPSNAEAFELLETILVDAGEPQRLADLYTSTLSLQQDPAQRLRLLRRVVRLLDAMPKGQDRSAPFKQQLVILDPADTATREELEAFYTATRRHRELAQMLDGLLSTEGARDPEAANRLRARLIELNIGALRDAEAAVPYAAALLDQDPVAELGWTMAQTLLEVRGAGPLVAPVLAEAYRKAGRPTDEIAVLTRELKLAHGDRLAQVQRRLAELKLSILDDGAGATELFEALLARDPSDAAARARYIELSAVLQRRPDAARFLTRAAHRARKDDAKACVEYDVGLLYLEDGEVARARAAFRRALQTSVLNEATLQAAKRLLGLGEQEEEKRDIMLALRAIAALDPNSQDRHPAAERLLEMAGAGKEDTIFTVAAYRGLLDSHRELEAVEQLTALCEETGDSEALVQVLEHRASHSVDPQAARDFAVRAARLKADRAATPAEAVEPWRQFLNTYGPSSEAHTALMPLLEKAGLWEELTQVFESEVNLCAPSERGLLLARLGQLRLQRLGDVDGALAAFEGALEASPADMETRQMLARLVQSGDPTTRLAAASVLEPHSRRDDPHQLLAILLTRAELLTSPSDRLEALEQAVQLIESAGLESAQGLDLSGRALCDAVDELPETTGVWLDRLRKFAESSGNRTGHATWLLTVLGDRPIDRDALIDVAQAAGTALLELGRDGEARAVAERAIEYDPKPGLVALVDELLAKGGASVEERMARYQSALNDLARSEHWQQLMHGLAAIEEASGDLPAAARTWEEVITKFSSDDVAHRHLVSCYTTLRNKEALFRELERAAGYLQGAPKAQAQAKMAELAAERGDQATALTLCRQALASGPLDEEALASIEGLCASAGDTALQRHILEHRAGTTVDVGQRAFAYEKLADFLDRVLGATSEAVGPWRIAAALYRQIPSEMEQARRLFERVLSAAPNDAESAEQLIDLYASAGDWERIPGALSLLTRASQDLSARLTLVLSLESRAVEAGAVDVFVAIVDKTLKEPRLDSESSHDLMAAKARVLASSPSQREAAAEAFQRLIRQHSDPKDVQAYQGLIDADPDSEHRRSNQRWLFEWRAEHEQDPADALVAWANMEEQESGDPDAATAVYQRLAKVQPNRPDVYQALARLRLGSGDLRGGLEALREVRRTSPAEQQTGVDRQMASLLIEQLDGPVAGLDLLAPILKDNPTDAESMRLVRIALASPVALPRASELLENAARSVKDPATAVEVYNLLLGVTDQTPALAGARRRWFSELLALEASRPGLQPGVALRAAEQFPEVEEFWKAAEDHARHANAADPLAEAYQRVLEASSDPEFAERLGRRAFEFHQEWFGTTDSLFGLLRRILELAPRARWAFDRLKLALSTQGRWSELFDLYDRANSTAADDAARADVLAEAAVAAKDLADDVDRAISYLEPLLELRPDDTRVDLTLERLYERRRDTLKLIRLLDRRARSATGRELGELHLRIADLWLVRGEPPKAMSEAEPFLADPFHGDAACALFERVAALPLLDKPDDWESAEDLTPQEQAIDLLKKKYASVGKQKDVARLYHWELELLRHDKVRSKKLRELVSLYLDTLEDAPAAFETLASLVLLDPAVTAHRVELAELADHINAHERLSSVLVEAAERVGDASLGSQLLLDAAQVSLVTLENPGRACDLLLRAAKLAVDEDPVALSATRQLDGLLRQAGRAAERCDVLERRARLEKEPSARHAALTAAAHVAFDELHDAPRASRIWLIARAEAPKDPEVLDGLVESLQAEGRWEELVDVLLTRAATSQDDDRAHRDRARVARLHAEHLHANGAAIAQWEEIRELYDPDQESFQALRELFAAEAMWPELATLLTAEIERTSDETYQAELLTALGDLHVQHTGQLFDALTAYVRADLWDRALDLARNGTSDPTQAMELVDTLLKLAVDAWKRGAFDAQSGPSRTASQALRVRAQQLMAIGANDQALALLLRGAKLPFERAEQRALRRDAAFVAADQLADPEGALAVLRELYEEDANDEVARGALSRFAKLLHQQGSYAELADLWEAQAQAREHDGAEDIAREHWELAGTLWENPVGDIVRAIAAHGRGALLGSRPCLEALARLHAEQGDLRSSAEALELLVHYTQGEDRVDFALRLADTYVALEDRSVARSRLEEVIEAAPDRRRIRAKLIDLYRVDRCYEPLAKSLVEEAEVRTDPAERVKLLREAAAIHVDELNTPNAALPLLQKALTLDPEEPSVRLVLGDALTRAGAHEEALAAFRSQLERYGDRRPRERALVHRHLAKSLLHQGQPAEALTQLNAAAEIHPEHPTILFELGRLAMEVGDLDRAEQTYRTLLLVLHHPTEPVAQAPSRAEVYLDLSDIAKRRGDDAHAHDFIESAFEVALSSDEEARALERTLRARERVDLVVRALENRLAHAKEPVLAARLISELAVMGTTASDQSPSTLGEGLRRRAADIRAQLEQQKAASAAAWEALGHAYETLGDTQDIQAAEAIYRQLVEWWPAVRESWQPLLTLYEKTDRKASVATIVESVALQIKLAEQRHQLLVEIARWLLEAPEEPTLAATLLQRVVEEEPSQTDAVELLAQTLQRQGKVEELARVLQSQLDAARQRRDAAAMSVISMRLGGLFERQDRFDEALSVYAAVLDVDPGNQWALRGVARLQESTNVGPVELARTLERLLEVEEGSSASAVALRIHNLKSEQGDVDGGVRALEQGFTANPSDVQVREKLIEIYIERGDDAQAAAILRRAWEASPHDWRLVLRLADSYTKSGQSQAALELLNAAVARAPSQAQILVQRASLLQQLNRYEFAVADLQRAHDLTGRHGDELVTALTVAADRAQPSVAVPMSLRLAALHLDLDQRDKARQRLSQVIEATDPTMPEHREALEKLASVGEADGAWLDAMDAYQRLLSIVEPDARSALAVKLAEACDRADQPERAQVALEQALVATPDDDMLQKKLRVVYERAGEFGKLGDLLLAEADAEEDPAKQGERLVQAADVLSRIPEGTDRAVAALRRAREKNPESIKIAVLMARAQVTGGDRAGGLKSLRDLLAARKGKQSRKVIAVYRELARLYLQEDDLFEAYDALTVAHELNRFDAQIAMLLGTVAADLDDYKTAERAFRAITLMKNKQPGSRDGATPEDKSTAFYHLGKIAQINGKLSQARMMAGKALAEEPENPQAKALMAQLDAS